MSDEQTIRDALTGRLGRHEHVVQALDALDRLVAERDEAISWNEYLQADARATEARCATLEAALREIAEAEQDVQWNTWMIETAQAALAEADKPAEEEGT